MTKLRVDFFSISLDGYGAGPDQSFDNPLGVGGESLHDWFVVTRSFHQMAGQNEGETGIDNDFAERGTKNLGAFIMGRNMFGPPQGGDWVDDTWKGWWGDNPPYHGPVFVLTHYPRASVTMEGGTTYHFVTDGIHAALKLATEAANGKDIRLAGGVATIRQYLQAGLIDQLHIAISPIMLGTGESLFSGIDMLKLGYVVTEHVPTARATHIVLAKRK
jgi:dihydrofolate reductase